MKGLLLRYLAMMVHHSDALFHMVRNDPSHPFASIPILCDLSLLEELKKILTREASDRIRMATGVPPHVEAMSAIKELSNLI